MSHSFPVVPGAAAAGTPLPTADRLRAHLMAVTPGTLFHCEKMSQGTRLSPAAAAGLVDARAIAPSIVPLAAPVWSDPDLRFLVRPEVGERLRQATEVLPSDLRLGFWEGLRPLPVQQRLWDTGLHFLRSWYPAGRAEELEQTLELYVARPGGTVPPHSTGSAVDIAAVDAFGQVLNPQDPWGKLGTRILASALKDAGLANYEPEWWHWSYGDDEWARIYDCAPLSFASTPADDGPGEGI